MGLFDSIKKLFSGESAPADSGLYLYVRLDRSGEIVRLRLEPQFELVPDYEAGGYTSNKTIVGPLSFERASALFRFDSGRHLTDAEISGGALSDQAAWDEQQAARKPADTDA